MIGAVAIVLAAMYMLRLISAVLHRERGGPVTDDALDLRPAELAIVVPLVGRAARPLGLAGGDHATTRSTESDAPRSRMTLELIAAGV